MKINKIKVSNPWNVPNQFVIKTDKGEYFQSYDSIIAFMPYHETGVYLDENTWDYSPTTGKYRNKFLNEDKKETEKKIEQGIYTLTELN